MRIDLSGRRAWLAGGDNAVSGGIALALRANGGTASVGNDEAAAAVPDILVLTHRLLPGDVVDPDAGVNRLAARVGDAMVRRGSGRIIMILSALAGVPARRFPDASIAAGVGLAQVRLLAMRLGPAVLVNAIGCGAIAAADGTLLTGDASMLSHVPTGQAGALDDIVAAVLFLCDPMNSYMTGQMLTVDGGWTAGYGRNF